jgi:hypothetical protein
VTLGREPGGKRHALFPGRPGHRYVPDPLLPLQFGPGFGGPPLFFRLFGLLFAAVGALNILRPREMARWQFRRRHGEVEGRSSRATPACS